MAIYLQCFNSSLGSGPLYSTMVILHVASSTFCSYESARPPYEYTTPAALVELHLEIYCASS
jgi:hypothetical protein